MTRPETILNKVSFNCGRIALGVLLFALCINMANAASVAQRGRVSVSRGNTTAASRMPTMTTTNKANNNTPTSTTTTTTTEPDVEETEVAEEVIIEDKTDQFDTVLDKTTSSGTDAGASSLAEMVRSQRAALDAQSITDAAKKSTIAAGANACDSGLRACMKSKCGNDFSKCAGDTDTMWGTKMDSCRRDLTCTGHEYSVFAAEIKADRDMNAKISAYNAIVDCGNNYNDCIVTECGTTYAKCLGKKAGDAAIEKCKKIANDCREQDSGLASRTMNVFGTLRLDAEKQVAADEKRLYELRDKMASVCQRLGAMFDERTLDCVYTVNFYAGDDNTLFASKKAYAGSTFDCTQNWFGIDVTTFKENAYRLTRSQTAASSAMLGSGVGMGVGAITSGAIDRALDRQKAEKALKKAEKEYDENYGDGASDASGNDSDQNADEDDSKPGRAQKRCEKAKGTWDSATNKCTDADCGDKKEWDNKKNKCVKSKDSGGGTDNDSSDRPDNKTAQKNCTNAKGKWEDGICKDPQCGDDARWDDWTQTCKEYADGEKPADISSQKAACELAKGIWNVYTCDCTNGGKWNSKTMLCECDPQTQEYKDGKCTMKLNTTLKPSSGLGGTGSMGGIGSTNFNLGSRTLGTR